MQGTYFKMKPGAVEVIGAEMIPKYGEETTDGAAERGIDAVKGEDEKKDDDVEDGANQGEENEEEDEGEIEADTEEEIEEEDLAEGDEDWVEGASD
jgi:hypothetical protein